MATLALDRTFNQTGILIDNVGGNDDTILGIAVQSDGKVVTTGVKESSSGIVDFYLRRYNRNGSADTLFNSNASNSTPLLNGALNRDAIMLLQQSNSFYVIGNIVDSADPAQPSKVFVAKYASDGTLEQSFGGGAAGGQPGFSIFGAGSDDYQALGAVIQSDGKVIIVGSVTSVSEGQDIALIRFTSSGVLDTSFGEVTGNQRSGKRTINIGGEDVANSVKIQRIGTEDRIVIAGSTENGSSEDFVLARYIANGDIDSTFGVSGTVTTNFGTAASPSNPTSDVARDFIVLTDNKILVVGSVGSSTSGGRDFGIARYTSNGILDTTFGQSGKLVVNASSSASGDDFAVRVVRDSSGKLLVLGSAEASSTGLDAALLRLNADGTLDTNFGSNGVQLTTVSTGAFNDTGLALAISPQDNSVVIAGDSSPPQGQGDSFIVKYVSEQAKSRNSPDFNSDGKRDLIWRNRNSGTALSWYMDGTNIISASNVFSETYTDPSWKIVSAGDFNKDGRDDVLWRNTTTGINQVWFMNGVTKTGQKNITLPGGSDAVIVGDAWQIKTTADFNKDGVLDILWRNSGTGDNAVWYMGGSDGTLYVGASAIPSLNNDWDLQASNDFNLDGTVDVFWKNVVTGGSAIWYLGGSSGTAFQYGQVVDGIGGLGWSAVGSGDFNNDGSPDLLGRNSSTGAAVAWTLGNRVLSMTSTTQITVVPSEWSLL